MPPNFISKICSLVIFAVACKSILDIAIAFANKLATFAISPVEVGSVGGVMSALKKVQDGVDAGAMNAAKSNLQAARSAIADPITGDGKRKRVENIKERRAGVAKLEEEIKQLRDKGGKWNRFKAMTKSGELNRQKAMLSYYEKEDKMMNSIANTPGIKQMGNLTESLFSSERVNNRNEAVDHNARLFQNVIGANAREIEEATKSNDPAAIKSVNDRIIQEATKNLMESGKAVESHGGFASSVSEATAKKYVEYFINDIQKGDNIKSKPLKSSDPNLNKFKDLLKAAPNEEEKKP